MSRSHAASVAISGLLVGTLLAGADLDADLAFAEHTLKEAHVDTDGPGLLSFFRARTLSDAAQDRLAATVRRLGDDRYFAREKASREIVAAGRVALPFLRRVLDDPDPEIARRAMLCLEEIERQQNQPLVSAAARLLVERRPPGTIEALLAYLPCADDEFSEDAVFTALGKVGLAGDRPDALLIAALADRNPARRAAAAQFLDRVADKQHRTAHQLLIDPDARVRFEAARSLARAGSRRAVPTLIALLNDGPVGLAWRVEQLLGRLAGESAPCMSVGSGDADDRRKTHDAWERWWHAHQATADMTRLKNDDAQLGLTLVCEFDEPDGKNYGRIWEFGRDGKMRWQLGGLEGPNDVQVLPGQRLLIAERVGSRVTERARDGKILWECKTSTNPICCQRLSSGNTLIATFSELFEVTPGRRKVFTHTHGSGFRHARRLGNGNTLYVATNGQVVELNRDWQPVRTVTPMKYALGASYWASVEPLPGGHFLLALGGTNRVVEMDGKGKIVWECPLAYAVHATRLGNGHTLVACFETRVLVEVDHSGKEVARTALSGRPITVRRY